MLSFSPAVRTALIVLAALVGAFAGAGIPGLPPWVDPTLGALAVAFAGLGLVPPNWTAANSAQTKAVKRTTKPTDGAHNRDFGEPIPGTGRKSRSRSTSFMLVALLLFFTPLLMPTSSSAHFIGELNAKGYADSALWSYGNQGWNWATVWANAGQGSRLGDHSYLFYNSFPWALRRREYVVPPRDWCYAAYVKVTHTSVAFVDVRSKARCPS